MGLLQGRRVLVAGARNKWSIGWHCALSMMREGASLAFSVLSERERGDVRKLLDAVGRPDLPVLLCDATKAEEVEALFGQVGSLFEGRLDGLLHSIAYAPRQALAGEYAATTQEDFDTAMNASVYTLVALAQGARSLLEASDGGAIVTLTYVGGERVVPRYNVMGVCKAALESTVRYLAYDLGAQSIRVNAVSAGPIKTLAAQGIQGFGAMLEQATERSALRRRVDADEVGDAVAFMMSPLARGITGETLYVDAGIHIMGM
ncbi:MAG: enoyl-ACP reductase [Chthonomonadales bacterium]|nr:enoyl-ACP reductase [Chthonomonadales bacterium]